jgi:hypothetical protein
MARVMPYDDRSGSVRRTPLSLLQSTGPANVDEQVSGGGDEATCKICMEGDVAEYHLITPCKCAGSVKYIHEECLKTWIASHREEIDKSCCELCKTPYTMTITLTHKCSPAHAYKTRSAGCAFIPLLSIVLIILGLVCYLLLSSALPGSDSDEAQMYTIALLVVCLVTSTIVLVFVLHVCKSACTFSSVASWHILSQEHPEVLRFRPPSDVLSESVHPMDQQNLMDDEVLVVPRTVVIQGRAVLTPVLRPCLTSLRSGSSSIAYATPKTQSVSVTPLRSRKHSSLMKPATSQGYSEAAPTQFA